MSILLQPITIEAVSEIRKDGRLEFQKRINKPTVLLDLTREVGRAARIIQVKSGYISNTILKSKLEVSAFLLTDTLPLNSPGTMKFMQMASTRPGGLET